MSEIALDRTLWSGFRLARKHPAAFGMWVLVDLALTLGPTALVMALLGPNFLDVVRNGGEQHEVGKLLGVAAKNGLVTILATLVLYAMLYGAIFRAVLRPEANRFGYLRLGKQELVLGGLIALLYLGLVAVLAMAIFIAYLLTGLANIFLPGAAILVGTLLTVAIIVALIWMAARLVPVLPMSFDQQRIRVAEAWAMTRGHTKELVILVILLAVLALSIAVTSFAAMSAAVSIFVASYAAAHPLETFYNQPTQDVIRELTPWGLLAAALISVISTFCLVIFTAPLAEAYRQISDRDEHAEEAF